MQAEVVGIKRSDFTSREGEHVKRQTWYLNIPGGESVEGYEVGSVSWDELKKGLPPEFALGELIEVEYNKYGRLTLSELPAAPKKGA